MAPVLFDQRRLFSAGMTIMLGMIVVFAGGYYLGYQKAVSGTGTGLNKTMALALPRPAHADTAQYGPHTPEIQLPGANIDVDAPDDAVTSIDSKAKAAVQPERMNAEVEAVIDETTSRIENPAPVETLAQRDSQQLQMAALEIKQDLTDADRRSGLIDATTDHQQAAGAFDTASAADARYTIQVGVFADSDNAMRKKSQLESRHLSAYIQEYTNKRDEQRFNVRFGYFNNKSSALAALEDFEQNTSGSGYVTRIRRN